MSQAAKLVMRANKLLIKRSVVPRSYWLTTTG